MRILVIGAGALGGYFGGRLLEAGRDVTFLVREKRAVELASAGLTIHSPVGDLHLPAPPTLTARALSDPFDVVLLSCKAYDLANAIEDFAPSIGPNSLILPLLNGMRHLEILERRFGAEHVFGGQCLISAALNEKREIVHFNDISAFAFGERDGKMSDRALAIGREMKGARFDHRVSSNIMLEMWEKWVFIATMAACTCLTRAAIGDIVAAPGGLGLIETIFEECRSAAANAGYPPRKESLERAHKMLITPGSPLKASMLRDIEAGAPTEADHIIGGLLSHGDFPALRIAYTALKTYEATRA